MVDDFDPGGAVGRPDVNLDRRARCGVEPGVCQQVGEHLGQAVVVAGDRHR